MRRRTGRPDGTMLSGAVARYGFAVVAVLLAFGLRMLLLRLIGTGAGFVLILAATIFTSLVAGRGPAIFSLVFSLPIAYGLMMTSGRFTSSTAFITLALYAVDGVVIVWVTSLMQKGRERAALSEAKYNAIIAIAHDGIFTFDEQQRITIFNEGAERIFGYTEDEMLGKKVDELIPPQYLAATMERFAEFAAGTEKALGVGMRLDVAGLRKNGEEFPAEASISKVAVNDGVLYSVIVRDITERRNTERALKRAVTARDEVLGIVAHDLRNPLSTIMMQVAVMSEDENGRDKKALNVISRSADRMNHLIHDLLDVAGIEAGRLKIERERLAAEAIAREAVEMQTPLASASGVRVQLAIAPGTTEISCDRHRVLQVFENLIGNAIKFSKAGGQITVGAVPGEDVVTFTVADTGAGVAHEDLPKLFEKFWQAKTSGRRLGAGLGLVIAKGIVEAHGGRIWAESELGRGTSIHFTIPTTPPKQPTLRPRGPERRTKYVRKTRA